MSLTETEKRRANVVLVGNPNTGKSTLFNRLTGVRQKIGNYPGVTVERKAGLLECDGQTIELIDLPGTYSLAASSPDERVVVDALAGRIPGAPIPDAVLCVVDASNLKRNLFLVSQVAELELPMVIALNLSDAALAQGIEIDAAALSRALNVPVISTVATSGQGVAEVKVQIAQALGNGARMPELEWPEPVKEAVGNLRADLLHLGAGELRDAELRRLLFDADSAILHRLPCEPAAATAALAKCREYLRSAHVHPFAVETVQRYAHVERLLEGALREPDQRRGTWSDRLDEVLMHRVWGLAIFALLMFLVFQSVYRWAGPAMDLIESAKTFAVDLVAPHLHATPAINSLVTDGIIEGVGSVLVFLPQIVILFAFIALLEDSGYMARAAFLMDRLLSWCGLNGKSFVPLLSSYACAVPGVLSTRTIEDPKARLVTILIAPLMSCSARLPVYVLLIGAFVQPRFGSSIAALVLLGAHLVGLMVAIPTAWVLNKFILRTKSPPFLLEMPPYRLPHPKDVLWRIWERSREFLVRAGTVIFAITIIIWALLYFPRPANLADEVEQAYYAESATAGIDDALAEPEEDLGHSLENRIAAAYVEQSWMGRFGKTIQPIFDPAGFDWKITVGVLSSFPAREVIIATLGVIYQLGGEVDEASGDLKQALTNAQWTSGPRAGTPVYNIPVAVAIMVFFALCLQCGATTAVMAKESNWKWATGAFFYMTALAWLGAVASYQILTRFGLS